MFWAHYCSFCTLWRFFPFNKLIGYADDREVSGASILTGGVFECDVAHRRSVYKIRCNQMHLLYGVLPVPYVPVRVTRGAVIIHRNTYAPPRCRTSQYRRTFIPCQFLWNKLIDPIFYGLGLAGFKSRANAFLLA